MGAPRKPWVDGTPCKNCRKPMKSDERYKQTGRLCQSCGNANRRAQRYAEKAKLPPPCRDCGAVSMMGRRCRACYNKAHAESRSKRLKEAPKKRCECGKAIWRKSVRCMVCKVAALKASKAKPTACQCGQPVHKGAKCRECFNQTHKEHQAARRAKAARKCACGTEIGPQARQCRHCNMAAVGTATTERRAVAPEPVARLVAQAWPGLRGPGGEWEKGPTSVQGWATLDRGRV